MKSRINVKKTLLYLSLIPYVVAIVRSILASVIGLHYDAIDVTQYGFDAFVSRLMDAWNHVILFDFIGWIVIAAIVYQIYYFITQTGSRPLRTISGGSIRLNQLFFYMSLGMWGTYFLKSLYALFFGYHTSFFFNTTSYTGWKAMEMSLLWDGIIFSLIPILPISLVYIIVYMIHRKKNGPIFK